MGSCSPRPEGRQWATSSAVIGLKKGDRAIHVQMATPRHRAAGAARVTHPRSQPRPAAPWSWLPTPRPLPPPGSPRAEPPGGRGRGHKRVLGGAVCRHLRDGKGCGPRAQASRALRAGQPRQGAGSALPFGGVEGTEGSPLPFSALISQGIRDTLMVLNQTETGEQTRSLINKKSLQDPLFQEG